MTVMRILMVIGAALVGGFLGAAAVYLYPPATGPDLEPWHLAVLDEDFRASHAGEFRGLDDYRRLEERLFVQLQQEVYERLPVAERRRFSRFTAGSPADPAGFVVNWNRTFEMPVEEPLGAVLMLHGLADSPYSMRALAEALHGQGLWVVGLRLPGHGTAPAALRDVGWQDFAAATRVAARYLSRQLAKDRPLFLVGHSLGAALAVEYSLARLQGEALPAADALVLISPAIGVPPVAPPARSGGRLAELLAPEAPDWIAVLPEFDPYRYNSVARNAGEQLHQLNRVIAEGMQRLLERAGLVELPRVLAFQSAVDSTVPPDAVVGSLLRGLKPGGHELVLFDHNRGARVQPFLETASDGFVPALMADEQLPFDLTLVTDGAGEIIARRRSARGDRIRDQALGMTWPYGVYSLTHIGLPFPPDDPVYGVFSRADDSVLTLGNLELRGDTGVLVVPAPHLNRLRYNPFFAYLEHRIVRTLTDIAEER